MKYIKYLLFSLLLIIPISVKANTISSIDMDIKLDKLGTATITETWKANVSQGTEGWHPYYNLGKSTISVVSASMDEKEFQISSNWNENASLSEKAYKAGIYKVDSNEYDVVFGISNYGSHTYKIVYKITNFVSNLEDADMAYWQLYPYDFSAEPDNVTIKISGYYDYPDTLDVWGFGMYGAPCYVQNGSIYMTSDGPISSSEYLTILVKFPANTFETTSRYSENFDHYKSMAEDGAEVYKNPNDNDSIFELISIAFYFLIFLIPVIIGIVKAANAGYGYKDNKKIDKKNTPMFRDIPCNKNIYYANALINLNNFGYKESNILGAILLKWVKQNKIKFIKSEKTGLFSSETGSIDLTSETTFDNDLEKELFDLMRAASGDGILEAKELEKWCRKHYSKFLGVFERIKKNEINRLKSENHIYKRTSKEECSKKEVMDDTIYKDSTELYGLKKFLEEFSRIDTREVLEVNIWDEYLMFAYLFGIADKVAKQLKNLYPETLNNPYQDNYFDYNTILYIDHLSTKSVGAASAARAAAESYSSGGGGFSSGGGGGGSFGGGGGGGGFR